MSFKGKGKAMKIWVWIVIFRSCVASLFVPEHLSISTAISNSNKNIIHYTTFDQLNITAVKEAFKSGNFLSVQSMKNNFTIDLSTNENHFFFWKEDTFESIKNVLDTRPIKTKAAIFLLVGHDQNEDTLVKSLDSTKLKLNDDVYMITEKSVYELYKVISDGHLIVNDLGNQDLEKWERRNDFQGLHFTIATLVEFPYAMDLVVNETTGHFNEWKGICSDMLDIFSQELNFTFTLKPPTDGTWNGILKDIKAGKVEFAASSLIHSWIRNHDFDWTTPYANGFEVIFIKRPTLSMNYLAYLQPFKLDCWLVFMFILMITPLLLMFAWRKGRESEELGVVLVLRSVGMSVLNYGNDLNPRKTSTRIILITFVIGAFLLMKHWEAILISFLSAPKVALPFNDLKEFYEKTNGRLLIMPGGMIEDDFIYSHDPLWQKVYHERIEPHLEEVVAYPDYSMDMFHFMDNDYNTAIYDVYQAYL